ncbi:MAG: ATP-dependent DNA helicase [Acidimicrobiales bacterium]
MATDLAASLARATADLPGAEARPGQLAMARAVGDAIARRRHLIVQAGTGTGKSLAYLVAALESGTRVVVATATKALQDQLATRDLPVLAERLGIRFEWAVLKGRSNYLCRQRAGELSAGDQLSFDGEVAFGAHGLLGRQVRQLVAWAATAATGDRADLPFEPMPQAWAQVSVSHQECPGAARCPAGAVCFAEAARRRAAEADVVVVNTHLYATHLLAGGPSGGGVLPPHDVVVVDEAHELEDIASSSLGFDLAGGRLRALARLSRPLLEDSAAAGAVEDGAGSLDQALAAWLGRRVRPPVGDALESALVVVRERVATLVAAVRSSDADPARRGRALEVGGHVGDDIDSVIELCSGDPGDQVAWVEGSAASPVLEVAPLDVGARLDSLWWSQDAAPTAIMTSATIPPGMGAGVGLAPGSWDELDVGSPFDYPRQALLYCARHLPDPRRPGYEEAMHAELAALLDAAGGRTLALFTSWRAMQAAAAALAPRVSWPILTQADLPKPALVARFGTEEHTCLFATMGFWQGVDIPGPALSLVTLDRIPFPRPDDPLLQARRDRQGPGAFATIDLPRAATLLAQGAGRLIRSSTDRGVVAVLDPRLSTARYGWELVRSLPPMRRTRHRAEVVEWLAPVRARG